MFFKQLAENLISMQSENKVFLVAVDGHGGSGKSLFAKRLADALKTAGVFSDIVPIDGFPLQEKDSDFLTLKDYPEVKTPFKIDAQRLIQEVLEPLRSGKVSNYEIRDWWSKNKHTTHTLQPKGLIIVEGSYSLLPELRSYYDFTIFIDTPLKQSRDQAVNRDVSLGADMKTNPLLWEEIYHPQEVKYMESAKPKEVANLVISGFNDTEIIIS
jgi:uridine kinase